MARFEPLTIALLELIRHNYNLSKQLNEELVVIIGSSNRERDEKNPLTFEERKRMLLLTLKDEGMADVRVEGLPDFPGNNRRWTAELVKIAGARPEEITVSTREIWTEDLLEYIGAKAYKHPKFCGGIPAEAVRKMICAGDPAWKSLVPKKTAEYLESRIDGQNTGVEIIKTACR